MNWINCIVHDKSLGIYVTTNRKTITIKKKTMYANFNLIQESPILLKGIATKTELYQKVWDD